MKEWRSGKSNGQNSKLHAIIRDVSKHKDEHYRITEARCKEYLGYFESYYRSDGSERIAFKSFGDLKMNEASEFIDRMIMYCLEHDIELSEESRP